MSLSRGTIAASDSLVSHPIPALFNHQSTPLDIKCSFPKDDHNPLKPKLSKAPYLSDHHCQPNFLCFLVFRYNQRSSLLKNHLNLKPFYYSIRWLL
ncbi:hypothetical protein ACE6H2_020251 [Prunus campanulata]